MEHVCVPTVTAHTAAEVLQGMEEGRRKQTLGSDAQPQALPGAAATLQGYWERLVEEQPKG